MCVVVHTRECENGYHDVCFPRFYPCICDCHFTSLLWVSLPSATFALIVDDRYVVDGPPYARGMNLLGMYEQAARRRLVEQGAILRSFLVEPVYKRCGCLLD